MTPLRVVIVDDERLARQKLRRFLADEPDIGEVTECPGAAEAIAVIGSTRPDVVFLDVQMPERDGFDVLKAVGAAAAGHVVFVTAHDQYAVRAFEVEALDYLLKPFDRARFRAALDRVRRAPREAAVARTRGLLEAMEGGGARDRIVVRAHGRIAVLRAQEIDWLEAADNYVKLHAGGREFLVRETLSALLVRLGARFERAHRGAVVNLDAVREVISVAVGGHEAHLRNGERVRLGRRYRSSFRERLAR